MLALHLLQSALVLVNARLVDPVLSEPEWAARLTERDIRGLTPLFWGNVLLHGLFALDLDKRLDYDRAPAADDMHDGADLDEFEVSAAAAGAPEQQGTSPARQRWRCYDRQSDGRLQQGQLAAVVLQHGGGAHLVTVADTEGNECCVA